MPLSKPGQITIEKTPGYYITEGAPERIHKLDKNMKLIVAVMRDPVVRAISDYVQSVATGRRKENEFERLAVPDPKTGVVDDSYYALMVGRYADHLERWLKFFPLSQFLFISGDEMIKNPVPQLMKLQRFLKIDTIIDERYFVYNSTKGFYCMKKSVEDTTADCLGETKGREHPHISPSVIHKVYRYFKPHNERFYSMIGQNFHWGEEKRR
nr:LOW QUALITY PROTEIN: heparan sulfate glucosamine 3-O-sulfotransferase 4-like [Lytechinus pictus]